MSLPLHDALAIPQRALLATVGGGGKTTLLFALVRERGAQDALHGLSVITTTTKMTVPPEAEGLPLVLGENRGFRLGVLQDVLRRGQTAAIVASGRGDRGRILGVEPDWAAEALRLDGVDFVGVEADGSAGRPFKAPADHEPVIPAGVTHVCAVVGVAAVGRSLDDRTVHRPQRVRSIIGAEAGDSITPEIVARVLAHPAGGRKAVPDEAQFAVVVTGAARDPEAARGIALACHEEGIERVVAYDAGEGLVRRL